MRGFKRVRTLLRITSVIALLMFIYSFGSHAFAATVNLRQTGQTGCWNGSGNPISCGGTGQDGDKLTGASWPSPRFIDNGNGTVTDELTDLVWLQNANCTDTVGGIGKSGGTLTWANALTWSNNLANGNCGLTDGSTSGQWRLPTVNELQSLVNRQQRNPATWLNTQGFANVQSLHYWSATTYAPSTASAWYVSMLYGHVLYGLKATTSYVWPVRAGQ